MSPKLKIKFIYFNDLYILAKTHMGPRMSTSKFYLSLNKFILNELSRPLTIGLSIYLSFDDGALLELIICPIK